MLALYVPFCSASTGRAPRVDSAGRPACEHCFRRLNTCKGKPRNNTRGDRIGKICQDCYNKSRHQSASSNSVSASPSPAAAAASHPAKKRKDASDPGHQTNTHDWDPTPAQLAAWKPDPQLAAAIAAQEAEQIAMLCAPHNFISDAVQAGSIAFFRASVAHHGIKNESDGYRICLYALLSPFKPAKQGYIQRFPNGDS